MTEVKTALDQPANQKPINDQVDALMHLLKVTAGSRFNAAKRLEGRDKRLTRLTAFTSAYVIALTVLPYFMKLHPDVADNFNLITIAFSIIILVSSLLQYSNGDVVNAEQHHRSALEISELRREMRFGFEDSPMNGVKLKAFSDRYSAILQKYSINHDDIDYLKYQLERPEEFPWVKCVERFVIRIRVAISAYTPSALLFSISILVVWLIFWYALPSRVARQALLGQLVI
jgi:hypothetical protein